MKIAQKQTEWEETAEVEAMKSRTASEIDAFRIVEIDSLAVRAAGTGAMELMTAATQLYVNNTGIVLFGLSARRRMAQAAIECWAANAGIAIPRALWKFPLEPGQDDHVYDPISLIKWIGEDYEEILRVLGLPVNAYTMGLDDQIAVATAAARKILFGRV